MAMQPVAPDTKLAPLVREPRVHGSVYRDPELFQRELENISRVAMSNDAREGVTAFLEKRRPNFTDS